MRVSKNCVQTLFVSLPFTNNIHPGQSLEIYIPVVNTKRYYSVSSIREGKNITIDVAVKDKGICSSWLCEKKNIGEPIFLEPSNGKFGNFCMKSNQIIALAGGAALGMVLCVLEDKLRNNQNIHIDLIHAVRFQEDIYDMKRINSLKKLYEKFNFYGLISREGTDVLGYVQGRAPEFLQNLIVKNKESSTSNFLMCGSDSLVNSCVDALKSKNIDDKQLVTESFGV